MIQIRKFTFNPVQENTYVLYDKTGECILVDPGCYFQHEREQLEEFIKEQSLTVVKIITTHCHFDHIMGVEWARHNFKAPWVCHKEDQFLIDSFVESGDKYGIPVEPIDAPDSYVDESTTLSFGESEIKLLHIPGHSPGSLVLHSSEQKFVIVGDVLFQGSIGRTDLPKGNFEQLIEGIKTKLMQLPEDTISYCGHGAETTIGTEKQTNPFLT